MAQVFFKKAWRFDLYATTSAAVPDLPRFCLNRATKNQTTKKGPHARAFFVNLCGASAAMVMMPVMVMAVVTDLDRLQIDTGNSGGDVQPGLALYADRLQRVGILRTADQKITAETDSDRGIGADAAVIAGELTTSNLAGRCVHRPGELGLLGETEIDADPANRGDIGLGTAAFALEYAVEAGDRADHEADILAALALQDTGLNRRHRVGAGQRCQQRSGGNTEGRESHKSDLRVTN